MKGLTIAVFLAVICTNSVGTAQDSTVVRDLELWSGINLKKSFYEEKLKLGLTEEFRFDENCGHLETFFTEFEVGSKFYKGLEVAAAYRFVKDHRKDAFQTVHRFQGDLIYKHKVADHMKLGYRFRYQTQNDGGISKEDGDEPISKFRLQFAGEYNIPKWKLDPKIAVELFYTTYKDRYNYVPEITETAKHQGFEKIRFTLSTAYQLHKRIEIEGFYRIEQEFKSFTGFYNTPSTYFIIGLNLNFKL